MDMAEFIAKIMADIDDFERDIQKAIRMAKGLDNNDVIVEIQANINAFKRDLLQAEAQAKKFGSDDIEKDVRVDIENVTAELAGLNARLKVFEADDIVKEVKIKYDKSAFSQISNGWRMLTDATDDFQSKMDNIANGIRSFGTVISNQIKGGLIASFSAAIPVIASLVPAIMAVGNAIAVVGGGAIGLIGAFGILQTGAYAFGFMAASAVKMLNDGMIQASKATENYKSALDGVKSAWQEIVKQNGDQLFNSMANGMKIATSALQKLSPFLSGVASSVESASQKMLTWVKSSDIAKAAFQMFNTTGVKVFNDMLTGAGRVGAGLTSLFTQFAPLFEFVSAGFARMSQDFMKWATSMETAQGIKNFINYTKTNLPVIGQIFADLFMGIFNLFKAFGSNSQTIFEALAQLTARFRAWSETVAQSDGFQKFIQYVQTQGPVVMSLIGSLVMALVNFATAMAPIGAAVLGLITRFTEWIAKMFETHPVIAQIIGVMATLGGILMAVVPTIIEMTTLFTHLVAPLVGLKAEAGFLSVAWKALSMVFGAITGPVLAVIAVIALITAAIVYLWKTNEQFRSIVIQVWEQIKQAISTAIEIATQVIMTIWGALVSWWQANQETIMNAVNSAWTFITGIINGVIAAIAMFVMSIFGGLVAWWQQNNQLILQTIQTVWNAIGPVIMGAINVIMNIIKVGWELVKTVTQVAWNALVMVIKVVWTIITTAIKVALTAIGAVIRVIMQVINGDWRGAWNTIKSAAMTIWNLIKSAAMTIFNALKTGLLAIWNTIKAVVTSVVNAIKSVITSVFNAIKSVVTSIMNAIKSFIITAWNAIRSAISSVINAIRSIVSSGFNAIRSIATSVMNAIRSIITSVWNAIKSIITSSINAVRSVVTSGFNAIRSIATSVMNSIKSVITSAWNVIKSAITSAMSAVRSAISNGMNAARSAVQNGVQSMVSAARNFVGQMASAGRQLIMGMINGVKNAAGALINAVSGAVGNAISRAKSLLRIKSPSRVFMEIGDYTMQGMAIGINSSAGQVVGEVEQMTKDMMDAYDPQFNSINASMDKELSSIDSSIAHTIQDDSDNGIGAKDPANINVSLGGRRYQTFSDDIRETSQKPLNLDEVYAV